MQAQGWECRIIPYLDSHYRTLGQIEEAEGGATIVHVPRGFLRPAAF